VVDGVGRASAWWDGAESCETDAAWKRDVALEIWIDVERFPILIRLEGTLERGTAGSLVSVVQDQILHGGREFELDTSALHVSDAAGFSALKALAQLVGESGGRLRWVGRRPLDNLRGGESGADVTRFQAHGWS
jgi:anti-anti-sigma regulatory factor